MMSRGVCSRSQGHCTRSTSTMRLSDTSSWPSRASSKASPRGTVPTARPAAAARARSSRASCGAGGPARATTTSCAAARSTSAARASAAAAYSGCAAEPARLGHQTRERGVGAGRYDDGAAAGQRPQRGCGRQLGGGADVDQSEAHDASSSGVHERDAAGIPLHALFRAAPKRRATGHWVALGLGLAGAEAAGLGEAVSESGL